MKKLISSKSGVQRIPRIPMLSDMVITERSSTLGYQTKLSLLQQIPIMQLDLMPLESTSLRNLPAVWNRVMPTNLV